MTITINLANLDTSALGDFGEKLEYALNLTVLKQVEASKTKLQGFEGTYQKKILGGHVMIEVDWSWSNHVNFLKESVPVRRTICNRLVNHHLAQLLNSDKDRYGCANN